MPGKRERRKQERMRRQRTDRGSARSSPRLTAGKLMDAAAERARQAAAPYLRRDGLSARLVELAEAARSLALRLMRQSPLAAQHECRAGCDFCCHTAVTVVAPEAFAIAGYLQDHLSPDQMRQVGERLEENAGLASSMARDVYIARLIPCALRTADGNCLAHPVRPIACAGFCSTSRAKCEAEFNRVLGRDPVPTDEFTMLAGLGVSNGLLDAFQRAGLDGHFYELHHALRRILDTPDPAAKWAAGQDLFQGCLR